MKRCKVTKNEDRFISKNKRIVRDTYTQEKKSSQLAPDNKKNSSNKLSKGPQKNSDDERSRSSDDEQSNSSDDEQSNSSDDEQSNSSDDDQSCLSDDERSILSDSKIKNEFIETQEIFNISIANHILKFIDKFKPFMRESSFVDGRDPVGLLRKYAQQAILENSISYNKVVYKQNNGKGRFYAIGSLSLQSLCREIRHTISKEFYKDIDMVNCHPVLLEWLCKQNNFKCKYLSMYIANRDKYINSDPSKKTLFLIMTNEGSKINEERLTKFEASYWTEMKKLHKLFSELKPSEFAAHKKKRIEIDKKDYNHQASFMNTLLCDLENKILMCIWKFYNNNKNVVLCFDGIMIRIRTDGNYQIEECQQFVEKEIGIKITLKIKEMNDGFDLTGHVIETYDHMTQEKEQKYCKILQKLKDCINNNDVNEGTLSLIFIEMMKDDIIVTNESTGEGYQWDGCKKLWLEKNANALMNEIRREDNLILKAVRVVEQEFELYVKKHKNNKMKESIGLSKLKQIRNIKRSIQSVREMQNIFKLSQIDLLNVDFKKLVVNRKHDLFPISGGKVINLRTCEIRNRTRGDYFSFECPVNYIPETEWTDTDKIDHRTFIHQIFIEDQEYIKYAQIKIGSYLCGDNCREIDINHGAGRNGKSCLVKALIIILGNFLGFIGKDVIVFDPSQHRKKGGGNHTSHLIPIEGKRLIITQELEENDTIDSEMIKKIASADTIEGVRECYGKKTTHIVPFCKLVVCSNKIPKFEATDKAIIERLVFNPFKARFLNEEGIQLEKSRGLYDETKFVYYPSNNELVKKYARIGRNIDILFSWLVHGCVEFYTKHNDGCGIPKPEIVKEYIENKLSENDFISMWVTEKCNVVSTDEWTQMSKKERKEYQTSRSVLYENFSSWAEDYDIKSDRGKIKFYESLSSKFKCKKGYSEFLYERIRLKKINGRELNDSDDDNDDPFI